MRKFRTGFEKRNHYPVATPPGGRRWVDRRFDRTTALTDAVLVFLIAGPVIGWVLARMLGW